MKKTLALAFTLAANLALAAGPEWSYHAPNGPAQWGQMSGYETCSLGASQSPIAIESGKVAGISNVSPDNTLPPIAPNWQSSGLNIVNNGHTIQVNYDAGSTLDFEGSAFTLKQFHFHSPSEHLLDEKQYPLEMHFVHGKADGSLLVVGVFFKEGAENQTLKRIWANAPVKPETSVSVAESVSALTFLPQSAEFFTYEGSLTTPPCSEGVRWVVMAQPIEASRDQLQFLQKTMGFTNNRPAQPLDGRVINQENL